MARRSETSRGVRKRWRRARIKLTFKGKDGLRPSFTIDRETGCWNSTGTDTGNGYKQQGRTSAHRDAYERFYECKLPPDVEVHHLCENKHCVHASEHLVAISVTDHRKLHRYLNALRGGERTK